MTKLSGLLAVVIGCILISSAQNVAAIGKGDPVKFSVSVSGEYTDNRDSSPVEEDNVDIFIVPKISANMKGQLTVLDFFYEPSYRYRSDPSTIQNDTELHHDLGLNIDQKVGPRVKLRARERFNITDDPSIVEAGTTLRRDSSYMMNRAEGGATVMLGRMSNLDVSGKHRVKLYDEKVVADESDETRVTGDVKLWHQLGRTVAVMITGQAEDQEYETTRGLERGFSATSYGVGAEKMIGSDFRGGLWAGWKEIDYDDALLGTDSSPYVQALLRFSPHKNAEITATGEYTIRDSDVYPYASQQYTSMGLDMLWKPSVKWVLGMGGVYRLGEYDLDMAPVTSSDPTYVRPTGGEETTVVLNASATFVIDASTSVKLVQTYEDVDADVSFSFTRNATRLGVSKQF